MTTEPASKGEGLLNLKRSICALELLWVSRGLFIAVAGLPAFVAFSVVAGHSSGQVFRPAALVVLGLGAGVVLGFEVARRCYRWLQATPSAFCVDYFTSVPPRSWYGRLRSSLRVFADVSGPTRRTAEVLGLSFEEWTRLREALFADPKGLKWLAPLFLGWALLSLLSFLIVFQLPVEEFELGSPGLPKASLVAATMAAVLFSLPSGFGLGFGQLWVRRYRPLLERETGLSVVEVMREFGYRPAWLIGWRRIASDHARQQGTQD